MGYSTITLIERIISQTLTSSTPESIGTTVDLLKIGNTLDSNLIPEDTVEQYIQWADSEIDSAISELYVTPLCEFSNFETVLYSDIDEYYDYVITTNRCPFYPGDNIILTDGENEERHVIETIVDNVNSNIFTTELPVQYAFDAIVTRIIRVSYPNPVPLISARKAAANIYEKYFMAESSPSESEYGKMLRKLARSDINNILNGRTILHAQKRIGNRFYNSNLDDRYGLPNIEISDNNVDEV